MWEIETEKAVITFFAHSEEIQSSCTLYVQKTQEMAHERLLEVDELHLQLQNLCYEAMHSTMTSQTVWSSGMEG